MPRPNPEWRTFSCSGPGCYKTDQENKLRACSRCRLVSYCSEECHRADWPNHKEACDDTHRILQVSAQSEHLMVWKRHNDDTLLRAMVSAMNVLIDPDARKKYVLYLRLSYHPEETRRSRKFRLEAFSRISWETLASAGFNSNVISGIQDDRRKVEEEHGREGPYGAAMAVLDGRVAQVFTTAAYVFPTNAVPVQLEEWRSVLERMINGRGA